MRHFLNAWVNPFMRITVKLEPMLGCVSVAPFWNQAIGTSDLGSWGGNIDYNQIREGTTLYLPVYQAAPC